MKTQNIVIIILKSCWKIVHVQTAAKGRELEILDGSYSGWTIEIFHNNNNGPLKAKRDKLGVTCMRDCMTLIGTGMISDVPSSTLIRFSIS